MTKLKIQKNHEHEIIRLDNICKKYRMGEEIVQAVCDASVTINKGEFVAIVGPSGSGKCVDGETLILQDNGIPLKIKDFENKVGNYILALDRSVGKVRPFKVSGFFKREIDELLEIQTSSGRKIVATKEHPFFTIKRDGVCEIPAEDLRENTFIASARKITIFGENQYLDSLNKLSNDKTLIIHNSVQLVKDSFKEFGVSRKFILKKFNINEGTYDSWLFKNNIPLINFKRILEEFGGNISSYEEKIKLTADCSNKVITIPSKTSVNLMEFYGFLAGDGNLDSGGLKITNIDKELKERMKLLFNKVFFSDAKECIDKRIDFNSTVLKSFFNLVFEFPLIQKSRNIRLPDFVFKCTDEEIAGFIKGLFDCDAYVPKDKAEISITLASEKLIKQLYYLLLRFGIVSRFSEKIKFASNTDKKIRRKYYHLSFSGLNNLKLYNQYIGFNSNKKKKRLTTLLVNNNSNTNVDIIPCGPLIRCLKRDSSIELGREIHHKLWSYEAERIHPSISRLIQISDLLKDRGFNIQKLRYLCQAEIFWDKVISVNRINEKRYVYDITVPGADNFIANGFIIHNSTMMNMVGALDLATKGDIFLDGIDIEHLSESRLAQIRGRRIGFIFQTFNLIPTLNALENVALPMIFQGIPRWKRIERAKKLLSDVKLSHRIKHLPNELSGGERQRVAIARALANDPEVILADEPTGNLDSKTGEEILDMFVNLNKQGKTIIMITHDNNLAKRAERIIRIKDGKIVN